MRTCLTLLVLAATTTLSIVHARAAALSYTCVVLNVLDIEDDGSMRVSGFERTLKGSQFSVSRQTGEIIGEVLPTLRAKRTWVVNAGSAQYSFKAVAEFDGEVQVLEVQEFRTGPTKPFISLSMGGAGIVTGTCK